MNIRLALVSISSAILLAAPSPAPAQVTSSSVTLGWTTPGDDGTTGTAAQFDLRYSTSPITANNFGSATRWLFMPSPEAPGTHQTVTVTGLEPNTQYYFAIKTGDDVPNWAPISNVISATTLPAADVTRPAPLAITVGSVTDTSALLSWTAVGDDSLTGTAASYDVRYSTSPITLANWGSATQATGEPAPASPGTNQTFLVQNLSRQQTYYFAARVSDESGNASALSNVPSVTTPDTMPPSAIRDLVVGWLYIGWRSMSGILPRPTAVR